MNGADNFFQNKKYTDYLFIAASVILAARLSLILIHFHFKVSDNDQALFWLGCHNFSKGLFYTPFIYGCSYGSMLECLLAVPFYLFGLPLYYALPLSNCFWFFVLILLLARQVDRRFEGKAAGVILISLLSLTHSDYFILLFAAKGHAAGIFTAMSGLILLMFNGKYLQITAGILLGLSIQLNPNALFLLILSPLVSGTDFKNLLLPATGALISLAYWYFTGRFLAQNDSVYLHRQWGIDFTFADLQNNFHNIDKYLNPVTPVFSKLGFLSLLFPLLLLFFLPADKRKIKQFSCSLYFIILLLSFGINKITDGTNDVLFHFSRFYLSLAICSAIIISVILLRFKNWRLYNLIPVLLFMMMLINTFNSVKSAQKTALNCGTTMSVEKAEIDNVKINLQALKQITAANKGQNKQIIVCDYPLYTELLLLETCKTDSLIIRYHNQEKFYWKQREILSENTYDVIICLQFDKLLDSRKREYSAYFHDSKPIPYFHFSNVKNADQLITTILR